MTRRRQLEDPGGRKIMITFTIKQLTRVLRALERLLRKRKKP